MKQNLFKKIILFNTLLTISTSVLASSKLKNEDVSIQKAKLAEVVKYENEKDYFAAVLIAAEAASQTYNQLRADEMIMKVTSKLTEMRKEIVVQTVKQNGGANFLFGLISGGSSRSYDITKVMTVNQEEVDQFPAVVNQAFQKLSTDLSSYVIQNQGKMKYAKAFAIKALELTLKLTKEERKLLLPIVHRVAQLTQNMVFTGAQSMIKCISTEYIATKDTTIFGLSGLISLNWMDDRSKPAYNDLNCQSYNLNSTEVSEAIVYSYEISKLELLIEEKLRQLGRQEVVEAEAPYYPTWR